ncbi:hypothetical protein FQR65_LT06163 [Abscondita terminalis]|nr:hypothetical protein FQR65_LT06163 [Abscondita terminalis]
MESTIEVSPEAANSLALANLNSTSWVQPQSAPTNSTFLFIAVEYVKDTNEYKLTSDADFSTREATACTNFQQHVSPLDPNMSSAARYSPSTTPDTDIAYNSSVVVPQLIAGNADNRQFITNLTETHASLTNIPSITNSDANILKQVTNRYLLNQNTTANISNPDVLQLVPDRSAEQEVELLITDQATGISYNVSAQEYLVERCLADEQQLLEALTPGPLLDTDLLALDDSTLKSTLPDIVENVDSQALNSIVNQSLNHLEIKIEEFDIKDEHNQENLRRSQRQLDLKIVEKEDLFANQVRAITDKPIETRARATLPASYLTISKQNNGEYGVFARKLIPKHTQFGPLEGLLVVNNLEPDNTNFQLLVEYESGSVHRLDVSDENVSNWMCFVRQAKTYGQQNLVVFQQGNLLYYTSTVNIWPKQELLVGYSSDYAKKHSLPLLQPSNLQENEWPCFECEKHFNSCLELQKHLDAHDEIKNDKNFKLKKKIRRKKIKRKYQKRILECKSCKEIFSNPDYSILKNHLSNHGIMPTLHFEDKFNVLNYNCQKCDMVFESEVLLKEHKMQHKITSDDVIQVCEDCDKEFINEEELNQHLCKKNDKMQTQKGCKCPLCYKIFASLDRIQKHMLVHGSEESKPLKCETCNKRFLNNSALTCHLKTHSVDKKIFECPMCKESFDHVLQLKVHVPRHCIDGKYTCPHCKKVFKEYSIIRKHIRAFHCERKHNCPHCAKPFPTLDKLRMHLLRHSDHREFLCADCGKQFKRKDKLKEHTKRMHSEERENTVPKSSKIALQNKKFTPKVQPTDYHRFIYKCHACLVGFKRRGMLVNHLAKRHPDISPDTVPELNLPILRTTRDYYCQYCDKIYKSSSKRKAHILKNHPGQALPMSNRRQGSFPEVTGLPNPTFSQTVGSITTHPQGCQWCHKQYASKAKLLQHQRKKHSEFLEERNKGKILMSEQESQTIEEINANEPFTREFKVSDEELLSEVVALNGNREDEQYYHIISVPPNESMNFTNGATELNNVSDSRLYRLLTTGNGNYPIILEFVLNQSF